ncbi:MAG TPA: dTDP-4-dehydrorhamnose 3,5-epimerase [Myxococcaceae bacterium]|nr:dTDP-4-dehydrorhamnose 3,5-epimerase [Myxococcaceae bacterium]
MNVLPTELPGVLIVEPKVHGDARGFFFEAYHQQRYADAGIPGPFVQDNVSRSARGILRGLHYQQPRAQGKLMSALAGRIWDVAVDVRRGSATFGKWVGVELSEDNRRQLWVPPGFAHGFCVLSDSADVAYKCTDFYSPEHEHTILWNDPQLAIPWPVEQPKLSPKDLAGKALADSALPEL